MKKLAHLIFIALALGALSWALWRGFHHPHHESDEAAVIEPGASAEKEPEEHEDFVVTMEKEKWKALEFEMAEPEKATLVPRRKAFGRVVDPTPLVVLEGDLTTAESALAASRADFERTQKLLAVGENTSRKLAEAAEAQFHADESKAAGLRRSTQLQWGAMISDLDAVHRRNLVESLVQGAAALIRVDLLPGDALATAPRGARLELFGHERQPIETTAIFPAVAADPRNQAQGYLVRVNQPPFPVRPGMAVTAWLELAETPRAGFAVPRSAILRHDGRTWIFIQEEEEKFLRKPVVLEAPLEGDKGWFVAAEGGLKAEDLLVVVGAQVLLSEELKAASGGAEEE
jgi:hypothetical protein